MGLNLVEVCCLMFALHQNSTKDDNPPQMRDRQSMGNNDVNDKQKEADNQSNVIFVNDPLIQLALPSISFADVHNSISHPQVNVEKKKEESNVIHSI